MGYFDPQRESDNSAALEIGGLVVLLFGLFLGWDIGKDRGWDDAGEWAVQTTRHCEASYRKEGFASVSDCLKGTIAKAEEEQLEEKRAEGYDPRR